MHVKVGTNRNGLASSPLLGHLVFLQGWPKSARRYRHAFR